MKRLTVGVVIGLVFGSAVGVVAQDISMWYNGGQLMTRSRDVRLSYAAGASDMVNAVVIETKRKGIGWVVMQATCLQSRSNSTLGQFTDFAETLWRGRDEQAASILLGACQ